MEIIFYQELKSWCKGSLSFLFSFCVCFVAGFHCRGKMQQFCSLRRARTKINESVLRARRIVSLTRLQIGKASRATKRRNNGGTLQLIEAFTWYEFSLCLLFSDTCFFLRFTAAHGAVEKRKDVKNSTRNNDWNGKESFVFMFVLKGLFL